MTRGGGSEKYKRASTILLGYQFVHFTPAGGVFTRLQNEV